MDIRYTDRQNKFRYEVRQWLKEHVPAKKLASLDPKDGFEQHRQWERTLKSGNWGMVTWPEALSLIHI